MSENRGGLYMLKKNYYKILVGLLLVIVFLVGSLVYLEDRTKLDLSNEYAHYYLDGEKREGEFFISGWAYRNKDELFVFLKSYFEPSTEKDKNYKYYRVEVYLDDELIDSEESQNISLYDYWNNYKLFKRTKFTKDDFKLVMKVYDKDKGECMYEKEISVGRFI